MPARSPEPSHTLLTIGQVLEELRVDFPGVTIPKLRFLEDKGLVKPERTPSGYRKFSSDDVDRLRYVLRMQRDHYLPLRVIGEQLDAMDAGLEPEAVEVAVPSVPVVPLAEDGLPGPETFARTDGARLSRRELRKIADVTDGLLDELEQHGLLVPLPGSTLYDADALLVVRTARDLAEFGLEPRHLRAFRAAADREVGLLQQVLSPHRDGRDETLGAVAALSVRLHVALVRAGLRRS